MTDISEDELARAEAWEQLIEQDKGEPTFYGRLIAAYREQVRDKDTLLYTIEATSKIEAERDALMAFKAYVHTRLDDAGVPTHPEGPHSAAGCRIGDRLDIVLAERDAYALQLAAVREAGWLAYGIAANTVTVNRESLLAQAEAILAEPAPEAGARIEADEDGRIPFSGKNRRTYISMLKGEYEQMKARLAAGDALALELEDAIAILRGHDERDSVLEDYRNALAAMRRAKEGA